MAKSVDWILRSAGSPDSLVGHIGLLALRVIFGGSMFFGHGLGKLMAFSQSAHTFPDPLGIGPTASMAGAVAGEAFAAILVIVGGATRLACIPLLATMGVAAFIIHAADPFQKQELALLYFTAFAAIFLLGPGRFSLDDMLGGSRKS